MGLCTSLRHDWAGTWQLVKNLPSAESPGLLPCGGQLLQTCVFWCPGYQHVCGGSPSSCGAGIPSFFKWWGVPFIPHVVGSPSFFMWWGRVPFILYVWGGLFILHLVVVGGPLHSSLSLPLPLAVPEILKYRAAQSPGSEPLGFFQVQGSTPGCYSSYTHSASPLSAASSPCSFRGSW